jgi:hypothetical protein
MAKSALIMAFGQSNADIHVDGPAYEAAILNDPRVITPNDGRGIRGRMGAPLVKPITGFDPAYGSETKNQSISHAAASTLLVNTPDGPFSHVIVRSAAKGGKPLIGRFHKGREIEGIFRSSSGELSSVLQTMIHDAGQVMRAAAEQGHPVHHVFIPFFHGEADQATDGGSYGDAISDLFETVDRHFARWGVGTDWLMTQPSGTLPGFAGNGWENRLVLADICANRQNAHFACANYGYRMADPAHMHAESKALIGELLGMQMAALLRKEPIAHTALAGLAIAGRTATLHFNGRNGLKIDTSQFPAPQFNHGFEVIAHRAALAVTDVRQTGRNSIVLTCEDNIPDDARINYAFSRCAKDHNDGTTEFPFGRGCLREDWKAPSRIVPDKHLLRWVPAFSVAVDEAADQAAAA